MIGSGLYTNTITGDGNGNISYISSLPTVATVNSSTGEINLVSPGTTVITATRAQTSSYSSVSKNYTLLVTIIGSQGPGGGIVFYDKGVVSDGWRYLEVAPSGWNISSTTDPTAQWKPALTVTSGTSTAIGSGKNNTYSILIGAGYPASALCLGYAGGGFTDWFLPSGLELQEIWWNIVSDHSADNGGRGKSYAGSLGAFSPGIYWSSSGYNSYYAWGQQFDTGYQGYSLSDYTYYVRPIRSFY